MGEGQTASMCNMHVRVFLFCLVFIVALTDGREIIKVNGYNCKGGNSIKHIADLFVDKTSKRINFYSGKQILFFESRPLF